jgi:parallel beta-helix repeat protein
MRSVQIWRQNLGIAALICGVGLSGLLVPSAQADDIHCGSVLGPGGSFKLEADVGPCDGQTAITVISASLDLSGYTVSCKGTQWDDDPIGIELRGKGAQVRDGWVVGCAVGVVLTGKGKHSVENINAYWNWGGFHVDSPKNTLDSNYAYYNDEDGFQVNSDRNRLNKNWALGNGDDGFDLDFGLGQNQVTGNWAQENGDEGFDIDTDGNRLSDNSASHNGANGFEIDDGDSNVLSSNVAYHNREGLHVNSANNQVIGNDIGHNHFDGIDLSFGAHDNLVKSNTVEDNGADGINLDFGARHNTIDHNTSLGNGLIGPGAFDLEDDNPNCDDNTWKSNTFGTKSDSCIQ